MANVEKDALKNLAENNDDIEFQQKIRKDLDFWYKILKVAAVIAPLFYVVIHCIYFYKFGGEFSTDKGEWGTFGDFIGGSLNPVFSLLAFLALIYTIKLQGVELRNSAEQLEKSASALSLQNKHWEKQNFESTFFNLLESYRHQTDRLAFTVNKNGVINTCDFNYLRVHANELVAKINIQVGMVDATDIEKIKELDAFKTLIDPLLDEFFEGEGNYIIRMCRGIIFIIEFIDRSSLSQVDKLLYANILENQLTLGEIVLLYFFTVQREDSIVEVMRKYTMFDACNLTGNQPCTLTDIKNSIFPGGRE